MRVVPAVSQHAVAARRNLLSPRNRMQPSGSRKVSTAHCYHLVGRSVNCLILVVLRQYALYWYNPCPPTPILYESARTHSLVAQGEARLLGGNPTSRQQCLAIHYICACQLSNRPKKLFNARPPFSSFQLRHQNLPSPDLKPAPMLSPYSGFKSNPSDLLRQPHNWIIGPICHLQVIRLYNCPDGQHLLKPGERLVPSNVADEISVRSLLLLPEERIV
ncbi:hypothetical protein BDW72DRAFT_174538 [Aspergillus terricola var. indicus]